MVNCGSGAYIALKLVTYFIFSWNSGSGFNNSAELIDLWGVLLCAKWISIEKMNIYGDLKVVIDWI